MKDFNLGALLAGVVTFLLVGLWATVRFLLYRLASKTSEVTRLKADKAVEELDREIEGATEKTKIADLEYDKARGRLRAVPNNNPVTWRPGDRGGPEGL